MTDLSLTTKSSLVAKLPALLLLSFRVHWPFFVLPLCYVLTTTLLLWDVPAYRQASLQGLVIGFASFSIPAGLVAVFLFRLVQYPFDIKPDSPFKQMGRDIAGLLRRPRWIVTGMPLLCAMLLFNKGMLELKPMIPVINPFTWDETLMQLDRNLHFGVDPWVLLQPIMGYDLVTFMVNNLYNFWFLALFGTFIWFGFSRQADAVRSRFFLSYMLTWWIGGGLMAVFFSSAGPVYYSKIGLSPDPFLPLMDYLYDVNTRMTIFSLQTQQILWDGYTGKGQPIGISAFPSMHNASSLLFALAAWQMSRRAGVVFGIYCVLILVGSVHLGWHYAVDGYAGLALAGLCWWIAGPVARWHASWASTQQLNRELAGL